LTKPEGKKKSNLWNSLLRGAAGRTGDSSHTVDTPETVHGSLIFLSLDGNKCKASETP